jgi:Protein of unknown function (DUF2807).
MKHIVKIVGVALITGVTMLVHSCTFTSGNGEKVIKGSGESVEKQITVSSFSKISISGHANVKVTYGDTQSITLKAQENLIEYLEIKSDGQELSIGVKKGFSVSSSKDIEVTIVCPQAVSSYSIAGAGKIDVEGKPQDNLSVDIAGAADLDASAVEVKNVSISIAGAAKCKVWSTENLSVSIAGTGNVSYKGNPANVKKDIAGIGKIEAIQ